MVTFFKIVILLLVFVAGWVFVGSKFASGFTMTSSAMAPAIEDGSSCLVNRMAAGGMPRRGEIVILREPDREGQIVRRVIALEGETVEIKENEVYINGDKINEPWLRTEDAGNLEFENVSPEYYGPEVVPDGYVFVLGDNRPASRDSRDFGFVSSDRLLGTVWTLFGASMF